MNLTADEKDKLQKSIRESYVKEVERRVLEKVLFDNNERITKYANGVSDTMAEELRKLFPL